MTFNKQYGIILLVNIMEFRELTNQEFTNFITNCPLKSIYQTPEYAFVMHNQNYDSVFLGLLQDNIIKAASLILIQKENGFKYAYAPRGYILNYEDNNILREFSDKIKLYLNKKGVMGLKINPLIIRSIYNIKKQERIENPKYNEIFSTLKQNNYYHLGYNNFFEALKPRFEAIIDLNKPIDDLFNNIKKKYKTKIRSAIRNGIKVYKGDIDQIDVLYKFINKTYNRNLTYFKDCYNFYSKRNMIDLFYTKLDTKKYLETVQKKLNYYEQRSFYFNQLIVKNINKNNKKLINKKINTDKYLDYYKKKLIKATNLLRNYQDGIITSVIVLIKQEKEITILFDGYDKNFKSFNSKHLLIWQIIDIYKKLGYTKFNLGGMSNITIDDKKYIGLDEFKLGFGSYMYEYAGDFELVTHKRNYNLYRNYVPLKNLIKSKLIK